MVYKYDYYTNIDKGEIFYVLRDKFALLMRRHSERRRRNHG